MTVTAPVSLTKIKTEFSGPNNLAAYTRGGTYVPNTAPNAAISTTAAGLAISQFLNSSADTVSLASWGAGTLGYDIYIASSFFDNTCAGATADLVLTFDSGGQMSYYDMLTTTYHTWLLSGSNSDYYVRLEQTGGTGTLSGSAIDSNLQLNSNRSWTLSVSVVCGDSASADIIATLSIRNSSNTVLVSKSLFMGVSASSND